MKLTVGSRIRALYEKLKSKFKLILQISLYSDLNFYYNTCMYHDT